MEYSIKNNEEVKNFHIQRITVKKYFGELLKKKGNKRYQEKNYESALNFYFKSYCVFRYFCPTKRYLITEENLKFENEKQKKQVCDLLVTNLLNISAAFLKLQKYEEALWSAEKVIKLTPSNAKAYYRKSKALTGLLDKGDKIEILKEGIKCIEKCIEIYPDQNILYVENENLKRKLLKVQEEQNFHSLLKKNVSGSNLNNNKNIKYSKTFSISELDLSQKELFFVEKNFKSDLEKEDQLLFFNKSFHLLQMEAKKFLKKNFEDKIKNNIYYEKENIKNCPDQLFGNEIYKNGLFFGFEKDQSYSQISFYDDLSSEFFLFTKNLPYKKFQLIFYFFSFMIVALSFYVLIFF